MGEDRVGLLVLRGFPSYLEVQCQQVVLEDHCSDQLIYAMSSLKHCVCCLCENTDGEPVATMWPVLWATVRAYAPYVTFPVAFVVGAVGYHLEWFLRGQPPPLPPEAEQSISERREDRKLQESAGKDLTQVVSLKDKLEFAPKAVLNRNRPEKN
ncbi:Small integral membrane protein 12 [Varanus komodoensis]|nr:Small integral membrane protein 12 [Varanus komodoensis]